jgi:hydroxymethylpyrimidine/phosphomethylpyrimidine kinase
MQDHRPRGMIARVLTIAGSDSGGGAGIEADIKTISALGGYACTAITAMTAQNTTGVFGIHILPADFVKLTIRTVLSDIGADAIKIGMLANAEIVHAVAGTLPACLPVVLDPVMIATSGASLLAPEAIEAMRRSLIPRATLVTPNLPETAALTGILPEKPEDFEAAGRALIALGAGAVLIKGGHAEGDMLTDYLINESMIETITLPRIATRNTHGTGCTLAAAIATFLAQQMTLTDAVHRARYYLQSAIINAPNFGAGHGPLWHGVLSTSFSEEKEAKRLL